MNKTVESIELTEARDTLVTAIAPVKELVAAFKEDEQAVLEMLDEREALEKELTERLAEISEAKPVQTDENTLLELITEERKLIDDLSTTTQITATLKAAQTDKLGDILVEIFENHARLLGPLGNYVSEVKLEMSLRTITAYQDEVTEFERQVNNIHGTAYRALNEHGLYTPTLNGGPRYKGVYIERAGSVTRLYLSNQPNY